MHGPSSWVRHRTTVGVVMTLLAATDTGRVIRPHLPQICTCKGDVSPCWVGLLTAVLVLAGCSGGGGSIAKAGDVRGAPSTTTVAVVANPTTTATEAGPYRADVLFHMVDNPSLLTVAVDIYNDGPVAGEPTCTVEASDEGGTYAGTLKGSPANPVPPGGPTAVRYPVAISNEGAAFVTEVSVICE